MLRIATATTLTNPNDDTSRHIMIKLNATGQEVKAVYSNPLNLDQREQKPNIKIGSEVLVLVDIDTFAFYVIGTIQQALEELASEKIYIIENKDKVNLKSNKLILLDGIDRGWVDKTKIFTEKIKISNSSGNELISLISEFIDIVTNKVSIGNLGQPVKLDPDTINKLSDLKNRLDTFKE